MINAFSQVGNIAGSYVWSLPANGYRGSYAITLAMFGATVLAPLLMGFDANAPTPGKRPLSSMTPTFMANADKVAVIGTPGGTRIITMASEKMSLTPTMRSCSLRRASGTLRRRAGGFNDMDLRYCVDRWYRDYT